jgi:hypothetical protein
MMEVKVDDTVAAQVRTVLLNMSPLHRDCPGDHGDLNLETLVAMLLEDVVLARRRPGSWEGANMTRVLRSHGYDPHRTRFAEPPTVDTPERDT